MPLISLRSISLSFGGQHPLLDQVDLSIEDKERICIVGRNGMGKSTLLKILNGDLLPDSGQISRETHLISTRLEQDVPDNIDGSVYEVIAEGLGEQGKLLATYQHLANHVGQDPSLLEKLQQAQQAVDKFQAWDLAHKVEKIITRLNLPGEQLFSDLSGGLKRRVLLGQALARGPHLLLLDEPTNHLDIEAIQWLETFLQEFEGSIVFITHDRTFLQKVATRIVELDRGHLQNYPHDYQQYLVRKQHELEVEATQNQLFDKKLAQEEVWIRQGIKARRTRNEGRVRALEKLRETRQARREVTGKANMNIQQGEMSGKLVLEATNISYSYGDRQIIAPFSTTIMRGDKIGIIGPNGIGKSTLIKLLLGQLIPQTGSVKQGTKLEVAYFDQLRAQLEEEKTVADNVSYGDQYVTVNNKSIHIITYLQDFLFSPERARSAVKVLSGGERNRLLLARLFSAPSNVLIMDEPTNDLDIETLELLEELLMNYQGTLLLISHDRNFLNNVVTSIFAFSEKGKIEEFVGGYDDWLRQTASRPEPIENITVKKASVPPANKPSQQQQKEARALEQKIEKLEAQQEMLQEQLADPELYSIENSKKLTELQTKLAKITEELTELINKWETLV